MPRYFLEVSYKGTNYSGFQIQENAGSVQEEMEKALAVYFRKEIALTGSSRTDTGVHAIQNFFHFDMDGIIDPLVIYNLNAILPGDIVVRSLFPVAPTAHCRFDALSRDYKYYIYRDKSPFLADRAYYFPYTLEKEKLAAAAETILRYSDFTAFSKRRTQVKSFQCTILESKWEVEGDCLIFHVRANRFLRGMVRGLVGTMLQVGRQKLSVAEFEEVVQRRDNKLVDFSAPGHGLFLFRVNYPVSLSASTG